LLAWLLRFLLAVLAARFIGRALGGNRPAPPPFDPELAAKREKPRAEPAFDPEDIDDAEYEELPGR